MTIYIVYGIQLLCINTCKCCEVTSIFLQLISGGIAVATYNEGATDFKKTPAYKESVQSQELLEEPDASNGDVFEANPTENAPSLE